jgi:hypothetical protein
MYPDDTIPGSALPRGVAAARTADPSRTRH